MDFPVGFFVDVGRRAVMYPSALVRFWPVQNESKFMFGDIAKKVAGDALLSCSLKDCSMCAP